MLPAISRAISRAADAGDAEAQNYPTSGWYRKAADLDSQHGIWGIANLYGRRLGHP